MPISNTIALVKSQDIGVSAAATATPVLMGNDDKPVTWIGVNNDDVTGQPGEPTPITVAIATENLYSDQGITTFSNPFPQPFVPLWNAAEEYWESLANINFITVADNPTSRTSAADIRVGVSTLSQNPNPNTMGLTNFAWDANNRFSPDTIVTVDDPADRAVTPLADGDFQFNGFLTKVFQDMLHELGHAIGLQHNTSDPTAIMNPLLSLSNPVPDGEDVKAVQELYGAPTGSIQFSQNDLSLLSHLIHQA